jgi:hypothetical protein
MIKTIRIGMLALALCSFAAVAEAKNVYRFKAEWNSNSDGANCDQPAITLALSSLQVDATFVTFDYFFITGFCGRPGDVLDFNHFTGTGTVSITGNQNKLHVDGVIPVQNGGQLDVDIEVGKTVARGPVILSGTGTVFDGRDLTGGQPSTTASITKSKN